MRPHTLGLEGVAISSYGSLGSSSTVRRIGWLLVRLKVAQGRGMFRALRVRVSRLGQPSREFVSNGDLFAGKAGRKRETSTSVRSVQEVIHLVVQERCGSSCASGYQNVDDALPFRALAVP
jgi:hypothetical protein